VVESRPSNRTERLSAIEQMLFRSSAGLRVVEIAQACAVDRRTIYRDLALLTDIGVPIVQENGRVYLNREQYLANIRLSQNEALALFVAARVLSHHIHQQNPHLVSALRKLSRTLPEPVASHLVYLTESTYNGSVDPGFIQVLEAVTSAWINQQRVKLWYTPASKHQATTCEFAIYFIEPTPTGEIHIIGLDITTRRLRSVMLQRVKRVKLLRSTYRIPAHFDPRLYLANAWGLEDDGEVEVVKMLFLPEAVPEIKARAWHPSQRIETQDNGCCLFSVWVSDWHVLLPWIRSWGPGVEVLEPLALREQITQENAQLHARHVS
jgi:predicted DNA-binding transcriptional regulator YafY